MSETMETVKVTLPRLREYAAEAVRGMTPEHRAAVRNVLGGESRLHRAQSALRVLATAWDGTADGRVVRTLATMQTVMRLRRW